MFPIFALAAFAGLIALALKPKGTPTITASGADSQLPPVPRAMKSLPAMAPASTRKALEPEQERLLSLLVLYVKDRKHGPGEKRYLTPPMASEAYRLTRVFHLPRTASILRRGDGPIPDDEYIHGRGEPLRQLVLSYALTGKA